MSDKRVESTSRSMSADATCQMVYRIQDFNIHCVRMCLKKVYVELIDGGLVMLYTSISMNKACAVISMPGNLVFFFLQKSLSVISILLLYSDNTLASLRANISPFYTTGTLTPVKSFGPFI